MIRNPGTPVTRRLFIRKDGRQLKRLSVYVPVDVARALMVRCAMVDRDASDIVSEAIVKLLEGEPSA